MDKAAARKHAMLISGLLLLLVVSIGCDTQEPVVAETLPELIAPVDSTSSALSGRPGSAFAQINELALGTLYLQRTDAPISPEQAVDLLPLWEQLKALQDVEGASSGEVMATLAQIEAGLTVRQATLLDTVSPEDLQAWAKGQGMTVNQPGGSFPGAEEITPMPSEERQDHTQNRLPGRDNAADLRYPLSTAIIDQVIGMLQTLI